MCQTVTYTYECGHHEVLTVACGAVPFGKKYCPKPTKALSRLRTAALQPQVETAKWSTQFWSLVPSPTFSTSDTSPPLVKLFSSQSEPAWISNLGIPEVSPTTRQFNASTIFDNEVPHTTLHFSREPMISSNGHPRESAMPSNNPDQDELEVFNRPRGIHQPQRFSVSLGVMVPTTSAATITTSPRTMVSELLALTLNSPTAPISSFTKTATKPSYSNHTPKVQLPGLNSSAVFPTRNRRYQRPTHTFRRTELKERCHDCTTRTHKATKEAIAVSEGQGAYNPPSRPVPIAVGEHIIPPPDRPQIRPEYLPGHGHMARRTPRHLQPTGIPVLRQAQRTTDRAVPTRIHPHTQTRQGILAGRGRIVRPLPRAVQNENIPLLIRDTQLVRQADITRRRQPIGGLGDLTTGTRVRLLR